MDSHCHPRAVLEELGQVLLWQSLSHPAPGLAAWESRRAPSPLDPKGQGLESAGARGAGEQEQRLCRRMQKLLLMDFVDPESWLVCLCKHSNTSNVKLLLQDKNQTLLIPCVPCPKLYQADE